jgi:hypothetical protein
MVTSTGVGEDLHAIQAHKGMRTTSLVRVLIKRNEMRRNFFTSQV